MTTRMLIGMAAVWLLGAAVAGAADVQCIGDAKVEAKECRRACATQFREAKDLCRNIDPVCGNACRDERVVCAAPFQAILTGCLEACAQEARRDKAACPPSGDPARDACIDAAQVASFVCRDTCRENQTVRDGLSACRLAFRVCLDACPPPAGN